MFNLSGKNVVFVGGFGGVGYQVSRILMQKNISNLIICSRMENNELLQKLQAESNTTKVMFVHINLMDRASIEHAARQIGSAVKHIDVLINGGGVLADKDVETTIGVNLTGLIQTTLALMPYMDKTQAGRGGVVLNISSVFGLEPAAGLPVYAAAKHGVVGFTRSLADPHVHNKTGIAFISVCPGLTTTESMMRLRENVILEQHSQEFLSAISKAKEQTPQEAALSVVKVIEIMKNGGIYLAIAGQLKEINPTVHWTLN